jgi:putative oxidoreductase
VSLLVLSVVAIASVHWPQAWHTWAELAQGYVFTDKGFGNFKYPVVLMGMLWTLLWMGPGRLSVDYWLRSRCASHSDATPTTLAANITHKPTV